MKHKIPCLFCLIAVLSVAGCSRPSAPQIAPIPSFTVEELLADPKSHSHTMVKVSGCYVSRFETSVLCPCGTKNPADRIWVEDAAMIEELRSLPELPEVTPPELRSSPSKPKSSAKGMLLFEYDEGRNSKAWKNLDTFSSSETTALQVVLLGQFETRAIRPPGAEEFGFGHLSAYAHELILADVVDSKPRTTQ